MGGIISCRVVLFYYINFKEMYMWQSIKRFRKQVIMNLK